MAGGMSFTPGVGNQFRAATNSDNYRLPLNATQALQILSLHLPDVLSGAAVAPDALLRGTPGLRPDVAVQTYATGMGAPSPVSTTGTAGSSDQMMKTPLGPVA